MKRELIALMFIFVLFSVNVLALDDTSESNVSITSLNAGNVQDKTNGLLTKEIQIPDNWQIPARIVFGVRSEEPISFQMFIILICFEVILLLLIKSAYCAFRISSQAGLEGWIVSLAITLILSASGGLLLASSGIMALGNLFGIIENWGILSLAITLILLLLVFYLLSKLIKSLRNRKRISDAERIGEHLGTSAIIAEKTVEAEGFKQG